MDGVPDFSKSFPGVDSTLKIKSDLGNQAHGPHIDGIQGIPGGTDQFRFTPDGDIVGGTTNIGKIKMNW